MAIPWGAGIRHGLGHGAYQAPDWTADWIHKEAVYMLDQLAMTWFIFGLKGGWSIKKI